MPKTGNAYRCALANNKVGDDSLMSIPFQTILVAIDESPASEKAFVTARAVAKALSAKLVIVHVLDPHSPHSPKPLYSSAQSEPLLPEKEAHEQYAQAWASFVESYDSLLQDKANEAIALGIETDFLQLTGSPGSTLCEVAKTANASLLVVGSHQRRGMAEIMLGSTSNYITHYAPCSVLVAYAKEQATHHLSVPQSSNTTKKAAVTT